MSESRPGEPPSGNERRPWLVLAGAVAAVSIAIAAFILGTGNLPALGTGPSPVAPGNGALSASPVQPFPHGSTAPPAGPASLATDCSIRLQTLVDRAAAGAVLEVPACVYRETVVISRPLTLRGRTGSEIRGSDIWSAWKGVGGRWIQGPVPDFGSSGQCRVQTERCHWPEQVFVDGVPLLQVAADPARGQFAVDAARNVVLGADPGGHVVEVTARNRWIVVNADDVAVERIAFRHAGNLAQQGAIGNNGHDRFRIAQSTLTDASGALVSFQGGSDLAISDSDLTRGGQLGVHVGGPGASRVTIDGDHIYGNNTEGFDPGWEAGGIKASGGHGMTVSQNDVHDNGGPGIWCDISCSDVAISRNRVYNNEHAGISFEISRGGKITDNQVWGNGFGRPDWIGGAGILCNVCRDTEIAANVVAWNADGIGVQSQRREQPEWVVTNVWVHDNVIVCTDKAGDDSRFCLGWVQDFNGPLFAPASMNRGSANRYWFAGKEGAIRFGWGLSLRSLDRFNATPGGNGGRYLTDQEQKDILSSAGIPGQPG